MYPGANRRPAHSNRQQMRTGAPESMLRKTWLLLSALRRHCYAHPWEAYRGLFLAGADNYSASDGKVAKQLIHQYGQADIFIPTPFAIYTPL